MAITFCCFDDLHRWNAWLCPPLALLTNGVLLWLIVYKTPKEMRVHGHILLQTCFVDLLLASLVTLGQPVLYFQPDLVGVILFQGYFSARFKDIPLALGTIFALWFIVHTLDAMGVCVQFLYRFLVLNCGFRITLCRYLLLLSLLFGPICCLAAFWYSMATPFLSIRPVDTKYFAKFMGGEVAANATVGVAYTLDFTSPLLPFWLHGYKALNIVAYALVFFCGLRMVLFVRTHTGFNQKMREMNRQMTKNLIILASFPLLLLTFNIVLMLLANPLHIDPDLNSLLSMLYGLITHWLPVINPLASMVTIRPYRKALLDSSIRIIGLISNNNNQTTPTFQQMQQAVPFQQISGGNKNSQPSQNGKY